MKLKKKLFVVFVALLLAIVGAFIVNAVIRSQKPKFEGRTATEWVAHYAAVQDSGPGWGVADLNRKELEVAIRSMGDEALTELLEELTPIEPLSGMRTNLIKLGEALPEKWRFSFMLDPAQTRTARREMLRAVRPSWDIVQPVFEKAQLDTTENGQVWAFSLLGYVGQGASNAVPHLIEAYTNSNMRISYVGLYNLTLLGEVSEPAIPYVVADLEQRGSSGPTLRFFSKLGPLAEVALPGLQSLMSDSQFAQFHKEIAATMLAIDPENILAFEYLRNYLQDAASDGELTYREIRFFNQLDLPNSDNNGFEKLADILFELSDFASQALWFLIAHNPSRAEEILSSELRLQGTFVRTSGADNSNLLLSINPESPAFISFVEEQVFGPITRSSQLVKNTYRIRQLSGCYSDTPGVNEILIRLESTASDRATLEALGDTRRHIELNDRLRDLREGSDAVETDPKH